MVSKGSSRNQADERVKRLSPESASDEVHRIIPLGFTLREARAWYLNHVLMPRLRKATAASVAAIVILGMLLIQPGELLHGTLTTHMIVQHPLLIAAGFLLTYGASSLMDARSRLSGRVSNFPKKLPWFRAYLKESTAVMFAVAASSIAFWYNPAQFDAASLNANLHIAMHATLVSAGALIFLGSRFLGERLKFIALIVLGKMMGLYGMFLLLAPYTVYSAYPAYEQAFTGIAFLVVMVMIDLTAVPLLLYRYFGNKPAPSHGLNLA